MTFYGFIFFSFSFLIIFSSLMVIFCKNPVHSVFFLVLVFYNVTGILLMLEVDFLAMIFLIIYVGAIAVLFLFVVMMLNIKVLELSETIFKYVPLSIFIGLIFFFEIVLIIFKGFSFNLDESQIILNFFDWAYYINIISNIKVFGLLLFVYYYIFFIISGLILLVSMVSSIILTLNKQNNIRRQYIFKQLKVNFDRTISSRYVK